MTRDTQGTESKAQQDSRIAQHTVHQMGQSQICGQKMINAHAPHTPQPSRTSRHMKANTHVPSHHTSAKPGLHYCSPTCNTFNCAQRGCICADCAPLAHAVRRDIVAGTSVLSSGLLIWAIAASHPQPSTQHKYLSTCLQRIESASCLQACHKCLLGTAAIMLAACWMLPPATCAAAQLRPLSHARRASAPQHGLTACRRACLLPILPCFMEALPLPHPGRTRRPQQSAARSRLAGVLVAHHLAQLLGHSRVGEDAVSILALVEAVLARELAPHALLVVCADGWRVWVLLRQGVLRTVAPGLLLGHWTSTVTLHCPSSRCVL